MKRPNLVIFNPDSYRGDVLAHLGNPAAVTPHLDALVNEGGGVSYANAFAQNPVCTPSRCSFVTGWYPHVHGHRSMKNMLKPYEPNLFQVLRREGYHFWWGGKNDLFSVEKPEDYLNYCDEKFCPENFVEDYRMPELPPEGHPLRSVFYHGVMKREGTGAFFRDRDQANTNGAIDFLKTHKDTDPPFCVYLPLSWPHPAYNVEESFYQKIDPEKLPPRLPIPKREMEVLSKWRESLMSDRLEEQDWRELKRVYYAMCSKIDHLFGQVVNTLKQQGLYDDTLIVFLSDHGDFTGDYGLVEKTHLSLQDNLLRVPFLIKPPASFPTAPGIRQHLTELVDMTATIYDLLDIDPDYTSFGKSLRRSLQGDEQEIREAVFAEVGMRRHENAFTNKDVNIMTPGSFYGVQSSVHRSAHREGSYAVSCRTHHHKYIRRAYNDHHELYDLQSDPGEINNLAGHPDYVEAERNMQQRLLNFFMETGDCLPHQQDSRGI